MVGLRDLKRRGEDSYERIKKYLYNIILWKVGKRVINNVNRQLYHL